MKMKRRNFLRLCAVAVTAPTALVKTEPELSPYGVPYWLKGEGGSCIEGIVTKARQQGFTDSHQIFFQGIPIVYRSPLYDETIQETKRLSTSRYTECIQETGR